MTRVVFVSEIPVAYRHGWFTHLQKHHSLDVRVLYLAGGQSDRPWEEPVGADPWCRVLESRSWSASSSGFFVRVTPMIGRDLAREDPDLVLLPGWAHPASWQAAQWCRRNRVPYGVLFENWRPQSTTALPAAVTNRVRSWMLGGAEVALPAGQRAAAFAATITDTRVRVLHANVADVDRTRDAATHVERAAEPRVLYLGRLMEHKGIDLVLDMAASLAEAGIPVDVAGDGPRRPDLEAAAEAGSLAFHGAVAGRSKVTLMARSSLVVVPSFAEPWGVVVQEALAAGTPVLASSEVGCTPEFIEPGLTGAVLAPERGAFESAVRSWAANVTPDRNACVARAEQITYASVADELESIVQEVGR